jgi:hypothetical protein
LTALALLKTPTVNISEPQNEVGRYQFFSERNIVFDTAEGIIYQYEGYNKQKQLKKWPNLNILTS